MFIVSKTTWITACRRHSVRWCQSRSKLQEEYIRLVSEGKIISDDQQTTALKYLSVLYTELVQYDKFYGKGWVSRENSRIGSEKSSQTHSTIFRSWGQVKTKPAVHQPKSIYLWGGTGCGKTFLMDLFYEHLPVTGKKKIHFHSFMIDVHKKLFRLKAQPHSTPVIERVAQELLEEAYVLCFDEFQVTDVADAMILKSLLISMFSAGAVIVATSNRSPERLYWNGLQRDLFLPCIALIKDMSNVVSLTEAPVDYRLMKFEHTAKDVYLSPCTPENELRFYNLLRQYFPTTLLSLISPSDSSSAPATSFGGPGVGERITWQIYGHDFTCHQVIPGRRVAAFHFDELCGQPLGAADYLDISSRFNVIFIANIPRLSIFKDRNEIRRLITLVDALYDARVKIIVLAEAVAIELLQALTVEERHSASGDELFAFDRTVSRLLEMQSQEYLSAHTEKFPMGHAYLRSLLASRNASGSEGDKTFSDEEIEGIWRHYNPFADMSRPLLRNAANVFIEDCKRVKGLEIITSGDGSEFPIPESLSADTFKSFVRSAIALNSAR